MITNNSAPGLRRNNKNELNIKMKFTRLVCICVGLASLCLQSVMGQEKMPAQRTMEVKPLPLEEVKLRADEREQPDSVVMYYDAGYKARVLYYASEGPRFYYRDDHNYWCESIDHFYVALWPEREYDVKYNSKGLIESMTFIEYDRNNLIQFQHNTNGYLLSIEQYACPIGSTKWELHHKDVYSYDAYDNWVGAQTYEILFGELLSVNSTYSARTDSKGRIVYSERRSNGVDADGTEYSFTYYIWHYSDGRTPNAEIENNTPVSDNNQGNFDLSVNIPVDSVQSGSLVVQLPEGFTLDEVNTSPTVDFAGLFDLTLTKQENNSWLIEIKSKSLKSAALRADEVGKMLHIAYKVDGSVTKGTYNISVNSIQFKTPGDNIIPEPAITVPVSVNRWGVDNEQLEDSNTAVYITGNTIYIQTTQTEQIAIYTINGSKLYETNTPSATTTIDASTFPQGVLIVKGSSGWVKKVVK